MIKVIWDACPVTCSPACSSNTCLMFGFRRNSVNVDCSCMANAYWQHRDQFHGLGLARKQSWSTTIWQKKTDSYLQLQFVESLSWTSNSLHPFSSTAGCKQSAKNENQKTNSPLTRLFRNLWWHLQLTNQGARGLLIVPPTVQDAFASYVILMYARNSVLTSLPAIFLPVLWEFQLVYGS